VRSRHLVISVLLCGLLALAVAAAGQGKPKCFGAAARDPQHPCSNPALNFRVIPSPADAELDPNAPCTPLSVPKRPFVCAFGADAADATDTVALIGDSHATHWRAALGPVSADEGWYGVSLTRTGCPLSDSTPLLVPKALRAACVQWRQQVFDYFSQHPEITSVFVSQHRVAIVRRKGMSLLDAEVKGYVEAWNKLPATVQHIFVIRDTPYDRSSTADCVVHARNKHENPGHACAIPRADSLRTDPAAVAARRLNTPRVQLIDLSSFMCDSKWCYPVVGGVLVHKDTGHLTEKFGETLAPYLERAVNRLLTPAGS
jgi:hypothetical protein